jgi:hypothetical protein
VRGCVHPDIQNPVSAQSGHSAGLSEVQKS